MSKKALLENKNNSAGITFIDLFSGCGGFSLGLEKAGLKCRAAIDFDESATKTFQKNHPHVPHVLWRDLTKFGPKGLDAFLNQERIDLVVGGPPCQGFSKARQADGANHGERLIDDPRRYLYRDFLKFVKYYQPKMFVMENVLGIRSAAGGEFFTRVQAESRDLGYRVIAHVVEAWRFGVPQKRVRQLIIGTRRELPMFIPDRYLRPSHALFTELGANELEPVVTLGEAIGDLPALDAGQESYELPYDLQRRAMHLTRYGNRFLRGILEVEQASKLTGHVARPHSARDLRDFARLNEGENSKGAIARGEQMEFPYDRDSFKDRFTRQHRNELCSTIVAHLKKDGLMFIHPTQQRSLTPREAARIQTFPDTFELAPSRSAAFNEVGNAVPPLVGTAVGKALVQYLAEAERLFKLPDMESDLVPKTRKSAIRLVESFLDSTSFSHISRISQQQFLSVWWAVGYVHPHLHPDAAAENGRELSPGPKRGVSLVMEPIYVRSGWPVDLVPLAIEARRRFDVGMMSEDEYYCSLAVVAGAGGGAG